MKQKFIAYIGTYTQSILFGTGQILEGKGEGIYGYSFDIETGAMEPLFVAPDIINPSFVSRSQNGRYLYAVNETKEFKGQATGSVSAFEILDDFSLKFINQQPTGGTDPCFVITDREDQHVYVANFMSGSVIMFPVDGNGGLMPASDFHQHEGHSVNAKRQAGPHAHSIIFSPDEQFVFVPDLGKDQIVAYYLDQQQGKLLSVETQSFSTEPGAGPRFGVFHPNGNFFYFINEISQEIGVLAYNKEHAVFETKQVVPTVRKNFDGENSCADIHITSDGRFLYGSNRGHNSIVIYRILENGLLEYVDTTPCGGEIPRNFCIDPTNQFLVVANQDTDNICVFRIDQKTGKLSFLHEIEVPTPVCIQIYHV